jgi:hypothetical protein
MPFQWHDTPAASGQVVDAVSGQPIAGAMVIVHASASERSTGTATDTNGKFHIEAETHWTVVPLGPFDAVYAPAIVTVAEDGYRPFKQSVSAIWPWDDRIRLDPQR